MLNKGLYILLEGVDDERFVTKVLQKYFEHNYLWVNTYQYSQKKAKDVCRFIRSINNLNNDYLFIKDLDCCPCAMRKKEFCLEQFNALDNGRIIIVKSEIESWYVAGLDRNTEKLLGIPHSENTENISKEQFNKYLSRKYSSRIDFMQEILKYYSIDIAKDRNESIGYLYRKYNLEPAQPNNRL